MSALDRTGTAHQHPVVEDIAHDPVLVDSPRERHLTPVNLLLVICAVAIAAVGQVLLRHGMRVAKESTVSGGGSLAVHAATSPYVLGGLCVFAMSAVLWLAALSRVPLSIAYPFNALGYIGILTASAVVLHEPVSARTWIGSAFVVVGLVMVVTSANSH
jgi:drug/metabolite transporter (DMT)-like permease